MVFEEYLQDYLNVRVGDVEIPVPYWINRPQVKGFLGGKGTAEEIQAEVDRLLQESESVPTDADEAIAWMKRKKLGVDCSGFVFAMSEALARDEERPSLEEWITPTSGGNPLKQKRFRTNADYLTREVNSEHIRDLKDVRRGDLLRLRGGEHIAIVIEVNDQRIVYAHSGRKTEIKGVHVARIKVVDWDGDLRSQDWEELFEDGRNYGQVALEDERDGVWRLRK